MKARLLSEKIKCTTDSTATERNKEIIPTTDVALKNHFLHQQFKFTAISRKNWFASWVLKKHRSPFVWVNVYGYFSEKYKWGGYGVILRDWLAEPITATAKFSKNGDSLFTQVLKGVKDGIALAKEHKYFQLRVICNSYYVPLVFDHLQLCRAVSDRRSGNAPACDLFDCFDYFKGSPRILLHLVREIEAMTLDGLKLQSVDAYPKVMNRAAFYISKLKKPNFKYGEDDGAENKEDMSAPGDDGAENKEEMSAPGDDGAENKEEMSPPGDDGAENKEEMSPPGDDELVDIKPLDFPKRLKAILWEDAFVAALYRCGTKAYKCGTKA